MRGAKRETVSSSRRVLARLRVRRFVRCVSMPSWGGPNNVRLMSSRVSPVNCTRKSAPPIHTGTPVPQPHPGSLPARCGNHLPIRVSTCPLRQPPACSGTHLPVLATICLFGQPSACSGNPALTHHLPVLATPHWPTTCLLWQPSPSPSADKDSQPCT